VSGGTGRQASCLHSSSAAHARAALPLSGIRRYRGRLGVRVSPINGTGRHMDLCYRNVTFIYVAQYLFTDISVAAIHRIKA
jgi:hypothetical protein